MAVYLIFRTKCQYGKMQGKPGKRGRVLLNNGELVFTYAEALEKYGITAPRFRRAIDELIARGFIDVAATGAGTFKAVTLYSISEWRRHYGIPDFIEAKRLKRSAGYPGFKRGNRLHTRRRKKKSTDTNVHGAMHTNVHSLILAMYTNVHGQKITIRYKRRNGKWLASKVA
jgi:hypothetical protein